tara:strand:+ start:7472 stop:8584 length:1113 start_codon:yes stop_codon:yes gene_type:complete
MKNKLIIAAFGFRSIPFSDGCAGADKFALELYPRLIKKNYKIIAYNRLYSGQKIKYNSYKGINLIYFKTLNIKLFDTLIHSFKSVIHIILFSKADIVHIQGNNGLWIPILSLFGKKVYHSIDGTEWKRDKWSFISKSIIYLTSFFSVYFSKNIIFDNIFTKKFFEKKFNKKFSFIPFGSEIPHIKDDDKILKKNNLKKNEYFLFVGRFIPDKGVHYLIEAYKKLNTNKKLVLVGGAPTPSNYEKRIFESSSKNIIVPGFKYGNEVNVLIKNAFTYIQPSDLEGLSPVILTVLGIGTPLICADLEENKFIINNEIDCYFEKSSPESLAKKMTFYIENYNKLAINSEKLKLRILKDFSWEDIAEKHNLEFRK